MEGGRPARGRGGIPGLGSDPVTGGALGATQKGRELGSCEHRCFWLGVCRQSGLLSWEASRQPHSGDSFPRSHDIQSGLGSGFTPVS